MISSPSEHRSIASPPSTRRRTHGFRFSAVDAIALASGVVATIFLWPVSRDLALVVPFALGHFFLFCNVFRIRRAPELAWAGVFLANYGARAWLGDVSWLGLCATQLPLTAFLLWRETRKPWYHGVFARRWNRDHLDDYLAGEWPRGRGAEEAKPSAAARRRY